MHRLNQSAFRYCYVRIDSGLFSFQIPRRHHHHHHPRLFTTTLRRFAKDDDPRSVKVQWYEQYLGGVLKKKPADYNNGDDEVTKGLKAQIRELEEELEDLQTGKSLLLLSPEDRKKVQVAREDQQLLKEPQPLGAGSSSQDVPRNDALEVKLHGKIYVHLNQFNFALRETELDIGSARAIPKLWKSYLHCRIRIPSFLELIPPAAWDVLWESQYKASITPQQRTRNLKVLLGDMVQAGRDLDSSQSLVFIEALHSDGQYEEALKTWNIELERLKASQKLTQYFEELGIRLLISAGQLKEAERLATRFQSTKPKANSRIVMPIIQAWAQKGNDEGLKRAWVLYIHLRTQLQSDITIDDYDKLAMCFVNTGYTDLGLAIFKDMMLTGQYSKHDSIKRMRISQAVIKELFSHTGDGTQLSEISLVAMTVLPRYQQNRFFYASWMKRLIGLGEVEAAASVIELMYLRNIPPDARHLNGIINAMLKQGTKEQKEQALRLGHAMIQERLAFVGRRREKNGTVYLQPEIQSSLNNPALSMSQKNTNVLLRQVPPATIETFSLLLLYYARRSHQMPGYAQDLERDLSRAEIAPNSYFMNHLLYADLRRGKHLDAWNTFLKWTKNRAPVPPDLETFACLWDCEKAHLDALNIYRTDHFPSPPKLFGAMMNWFNDLKENGRRSTLKDFSSEVYTQIIRCFCLSKDLEGTLVALNALKDHFDMYPDENAIRMVTLQVAKMSQAEPIVYKRKRPGVEPTFHRKHSIITREKAAIATVSSILEVLAQERAWELEKKNVDPKQLNGEQQAKENLHLLARFLRAVIRKSVESDAEVDDAVQKVAWEMGVGGVATDESAHSPDVVLSVEGADRTVRVSH